MKRDMDLIRQIVLAVRESSTPIEGLGGVEQVVFFEHVRLLVEAGFVEAKAFASGEVEVSRLTWDGHNFADSILSDSVWNKAKMDVIKPTLSWSFAVLQEYLKQSALGSLGL